MKHIAEQSEMAIRTEGLRFPMSSFDFLRDIMDARHAEAVRLMEQKIEWVWDISSVSAARRSELRMLKESVYELKAGKEPTPLSEDEVYNRIVPSHLGKIKAAKIASRLACRPEHIHRLIKEQALVTITASTRGAQGSPEVTRDSLIAFLKSRRVQ